MHTIQVYVNENLNEAQIEDLKVSIRSLPHVVNVEMNSRMPHDMLVEYDESYREVPMEVIGCLSGKGLHSDIYSG